MYIRHILCVTNYLYKYQYLCIRKYLCIPDYNTAYDSTDADQATNNKSDYRVIREHVLSFAVFFRIH